MNHPVFCWTKYMAQLMTLRVMRVIIWRQRRQRRWEMQEFTEMCLIIENAIFYRLGFENALLLYRSIKNAFVCTGGLENVILFHRA